MKIMEIEGERNLSGTIRISGAKNATVALIPAAILTDEEVTIGLKDLAEKLTPELKIEVEVNRMDPLFKDKAEYKEFSDRMSKYTVKRGELKSYKGNVFLGIDAGSTTTKLALIGEDGELLYDFYSNNNRLSVYGRSSVFS